jgi:hypothetical protein
MNAADRARTKRETVPLTSEQKRRFIIAIFVLLALAGLIGWWVYRVFFTNDLAGLGQD